MNIEYRIRQIELRESQENESPTIVGNAAVYNVISDNLGGFYEIIEPGFFSNVLENDVRALLNHDRNYILGRNKSTLQLFDGMDALGFEVEPPQTQIINELVIIPMRRKDLTQCSFGFNVADGGDQWETMEDGSILRRLLPGGCSELFDISIVTYAAYPQTSNEVREKLEKFASGSGPMANDADVETPKQAPTGNKLKIQKIELLKARIKR
jgi:HK97 family phage prohead protease